MFGRKKSDTADEPRRLLRPAAAGEPGTAAARPPSVPAAEIVTVTDDNFMDVTEGGYTIVDFWAPWCGPCLRFAPVFEAVAARMGEGISFGKCDIDDNPRTSELLGIQSIPTLVVFGPDGSEVERRIGALPPPAFMQLVTDVARTAAAS